MTRTTGPGCALVGLGSMGFGMATSLARGGFDVWGIDISDEAMTRFREAGGQRGAPDYAKISVAVIVVLNAAQTESVLFGDSGIVPAMRSGAVVVACATVPPAFARDMTTRCADHGVLYLDAPISGGAAKAAEGRLSIMASGSAEAFAAARPALDAMAETVFELGNEPGRGSAMKSVNQLMAGVHIATMAEAIAFAGTQGIPPAEVLDVISQCAGSSWMFENRAPHIVDGDYTPRSSVAIWPKDLGIVGEIAEAAGMDVPLTRAALTRFRAAAAAGLEREDDAAVFKIYARELGLEIPGEKS